MRMLVVEPDSALAKLLQETFRSEQYDVDVCPDKSSAVGCAMATAYDVMLLDLRLPEASELAIVKQIRVSKPDSAIVVLSASAGVEDRVASLEAGADECLAKPFSLLELSMRMRGVLRRQSGNRASILQVGDLKLDRLRHTVTRAGRLIRLSRREYALLEYLMSNAGCQLSRELILQHVWGVTGHWTTNLTDVYIRALRTRLNVEGLPPLIHTVRGVGYEISCPASRAPTTVAEGAV